MPLPDNLTEITLADALRDWHEATQMIIDYRDKEEPLDIAGGWQFEKASLKSPGDNQDKYSLYIIWKGYDGKTVNDLLSIRASINEAGGIAITRSKRFRYPL